MAAKRPAVYSVGCQRRPHDDHGMIKIGKSGEASRRGGRPRTIIDLRQVQEYRRQGLSFRKIATLLHVGDGTVRRALQADADRTAARQNP